MSTARKSAARKSTAKPRRWPARVSRRSNALDLQSGVFKKDDPAAIARSLKRTAEASTRRKADPYRSAMSMLTFYINRAGNKLSKREHAKLEQAKQQLRAQFHRPAPRA